MKFIKKIIAKWSQQGSALIDQEHYDGSAQVVYEEPISSTISSEGIQFTLYVAEGGKIVETRTRDRKTGERQLQLYVLRDDMDLGREISKIITIESLKV